MPQTPQMPNSKKPQHAPQEVSPAAERLAMQNAPQDADAENLPAAQTMRTDAQPVQPAGGIKQKMHDTLRSKRAWGVLAVMLFFLAGATVIPVSKVPLVRNLVYAMGFSADETAHLSLLEALFTWNDHAKAQRGEVPSPDELPIFHKAQTAATAVPGTAKPKNGLLNIKAVNAALRRQGRNAEQVADASGNTLDKDRPDTAPVHLNNPNAATNTEANGSQISDVYFGEDTNAVARDKQDGYNSVATLKKVAKSNHVVRGASSSQSDWLLDQVDRARRQDAELGDLAANLEAHGVSSGKVSAGKIGDDKAHRDMYWAWLTGRAARRTPQVVLKKTLATTAYDGADLPHSVFTASGFSGVGITSTELVGDIDLAQKYIELDKKCKDAMEAVKIDYKDLRETIKGLRDTVPTTCGDGLSKGFNNYRTESKKISDACKQMKDEYRQVGSACSISFTQTGSICYDTAVDGAVNRFEKWCQSEEVQNACANEEDPQACINNKKWDEQPLSSEDLKTADLAGSINNAYYKDGDATNETLSVSFFPSVNWQESLSGQFEGRDEL